MRQYEVQVWREPPEKHDSMGLGPADIECWHNTNWGGNNLDDVKKFVERLESEEGKQLRICEVLYVTPGITRTY